MTVSAPSVSPAQAQRLKGATRALIAAAGGVDGVAATLGIGHSQVSRYQTLNDAAIIPIDKVAALEALDGVPPHVTRALAGLSGHVLVELPRGAGAGQLIQTCGELAREIGDVMAALGQALADDGQVSVRERDGLEMLTNLDQAAGKLATLRTMLVKLSEQNLPPALRSVSGGKS
jgi:hypothetical protein